MTVDLPKVGDTYTASHTFTAEAIRTFATLIGDTNPMHHDEAAGTAKFGGLIASGSHSSSVLMGNAAAWISEYGESVGLGYAVRLRRPILAGTTAVIEWQIVSIERSTKPRGTIAKLEGRLLSGSGEVAVTATTDCLFFD